MNGFYGFVSIFTAAETTSTSRSEKTTITTVNGKTVKTRVITTTTNGVSETETIIEGEVDEEKPQETEQPIQSEPEKVSFSMQPYR